jgi:hypothetical protein
MIVAWGKEGGIGEGRHGGRGGERHGGGSVALALDNGL